MNEELNNTWTSKLGKAADIFIDPIQQRMSNPIVGSFALTWCTLNWQPIVFFIFSKQSIECKLGYISSNFYKGDWFIFHQNWWMYLIIPFLISISYIFASQRIENLIDSVNNKPIERKKSFNQKVALGILGNQKAIATAEAGVIEAKLHYKDLKEKEELIKQLKDQSNQFEEQITKLTDENSKYFFEVNELKIEKLSIQKEFSESKQDLALEIINKDDLILEIRNNFNEITFDLNQHKSIIKTLETKILAMTDSYSDAFGKALNYTTINQAKQLSEEIIDITGEILGIPLQEKITNYLDEMKHNPPSHSLMISFKDSFNVDNTNVLQVLNSIFKVKEHSVNRNNELRCEISYRVKNDAFTNHSKIIESVIGVNQVWVPREN